MLSKLKETVTVSEAEAICHDCNEVVARGELLIGLSDMLRGGGMAKGKLFSDCKGHHNEFRKWEEPDLPKHDEFTVRQGLKEIGEFRVSTGVSEVMIKVTDKAINEELSDMTGVYIRKLRGY
jgi:hypothetical protein